MVPDDGKYFTSERRQCPACGDGPCHDGTLCSGSRRRSMGIIAMVTVSGMSAAAHAAQLAILSTRIDEKLRHPRYQDAPRSPKPRFRKGR